MSLSEADRITFISSVQLKPINSTRSPPHWHVSITDDDEASFVSAGSILSFLGNSSIQMREDVINSTLFAQLGADARYDRQNDAQNWYIYFKQILETVGWIAQDFDFSFITDANSYCTVGNLIAQLCKTHLDSKELILLRRNLAALGGPPNDTAGRLLNSCAKASNRANFYVGCISVSGGSAMFKISAVTYTATENINDLLLFEFGSQKINFRYGDQTMLLNSAVYSPVRESVLARLGENAKNLVEQIRVIY